MMKANYLGLANVSRVAKPGGRARQRLSSGALRSLRSDLRRILGGFRALFAETDVIAISEPLVRAMAGLPARVGGCGASTVRVTPRATTQPCVYWPGAGEPLSLLLSLGSQIGGHSALRRGAHHPPKHAARVHSSLRAAVAAPDARLQNALYEPDFYCPVVRGKTEKLEVRMAPARELPKAKVRAPPS